MSPSTPTLPVLSSFTPAAWEDVARCALPECQCSQRHTLLALLHRDLRVGRRQLGIFLIRTLIQPAFLVFVLGYLMPRMHLVGDSVSQLLVPGMIGMSMFFAGMQAVTFPLVDEFGYSRELDDRLMAPIAIRWVAVEKILVGTVHALLAGAAVLPFSAWLVAMPELLHGATLLGFLAMGLLVALVSASFGLLLGVIIPPQKLGVMTAAVVAPLLFLGCTYYPWQALRILPWLQKAVLANPLVYACEGLRGVLTPHLAHMPMAASLLGLVVALALCATLGIRWFEKKLLD